MDRDNSDVVFTSFDELIAYYVANAEVGVLYLLNGETDNAAQVPQQQIPPKRDDPDVPSL